MSEYYNPTIAVFPAVESDPLNPVLGQSWFNTTEGKAKIKTAAGVKEYQFGTAPSGIQLDACTSFTLLDDTWGGGSITHAANVVIVFEVMSPIAPTRVRATPYIDATLLGSPTADQDVRRYWAWLADAGVANWQIEWASAQQYAIIIISTWTGTTEPTGFEGTGYVGPDYSSPIAQSIAIGTAGRMIFHSVGVYQPSDSTAPAITLDAQLTLVKDQAVTWAGHCAARLKFGRQADAGAKSYSSAWSGASGCVSYSSITALTP